jgi:hypothetical protein
MEEQVNQQFEQFQNSFKTAFETSQKMMEPTLRSSEVVIDSLGQLARDQFEFGRTCMDIGRKQFETLQKSDDPSAVFQDTDTPSEYYNAALKYGEAVSQNAERTGERMMSIGNELVDTLTQAATAQGKKASEQAASSAKKATSKSA